MYTEATNVPRLLGGTNAVAKEYTRNTSSAKDSGIQPRVEVALPFPIVLRGKAPLDDRFEICTVVDRLSGQDVTLRLPHPQPLGAKLFGYIHLLPVSMPERPAPGVAFYGIVQSNKLELDNRWCVTVRFERHRFLYASKETT